MCAYDCRYRRRPEVPVFLKLELQAVISYPVWVLGTDLGSFVRACTLETAEPSVQPLLFKCFNRSFSRLSSSILLYYFKADNFFFPLLKSW